MKLRIVTDSASDLPKGLADELGIEILPILVYVDGVEYLDGETLQSNELYQRMIEGKNIKTAQIPLAYFMDKFESYAKGDDHIVYLAFSSVLSGTYQTAVLAYEEIKEKYPTFEMTIIDTKCVSLGLGVIVTEAAKLAAEGASLEELVSFIEKNTVNMEHVFSVDDLNYLLRGGRVSKSQAVIGNILNIKPILHVVDGALVPFDKAKGTKKKMARMFEYIAERGKNLDGQTIGIAHALNDEEAQMVKEHFETVYGTRHFIINQLGCAVGAHCGPGLITIFFKKEV